MEAKTQNIVHGRSNGLQYIVSGGGDVLPPPDSQNTGVHWLRISFHNKYLHVLTSYLENVFGKSSSDGFGLWSYEYRFIWKNGASLNFDKDPGRAVLVHQDKCTLDIPGGALDKMEIYEKLDMFKRLLDLGGKCTRIDIYYDDYKRLVTYKKLVAACNKGDFSGVKSFANRQKKIMVEDAKMKTIRQEVSFGQRGSRGNGKYLRWYNKELESNGEIEADRWEVEFTEKKADMAFRGLASLADDEKAFALLCGSLIAGCITFVHRNGDKNISRLSKYSWWESICEILGDGVRLSEKRPDETVDSKIKYIRHNATVWAFIRKVFNSDIDFINFVFDICSDGDERLKTSTRQLIEDNYRSLVYIDGNIHKNFEKEKL